MPADIRRVAIIKPCCIGDAVMSLPVVDSIHAEHPNAEIHVWTGSHSRPIFEGCPSVNRVKTIPDVPSALDVPALLWRLRRARFDLVCLLDRSRLVTAACKMAGPPRIATIRNGPADGRHEIDVYLDALDRLGIPASVACPVASFTVDQLRAGELFAARMGRPYIVLHPGGAENPGALMRSKRWPADRWIDLIRWARQRGFGVALTGSPGERELCRKIAERAGGHGIEIAAGRYSLMDSAALVQHARAFAGPDTGMSHLSAASGVPTLVLFGPTNPDRYAPRGRSVVVISTPASRRLPDVDLRRPAKVDPAVAMAGIGIDEVVDALEAALTPSSESGRG